MTWFNSSDIDGCDQTSTMEAGSGKATFCPLCRELGQKSRLRLFQINAKEALTLCSKKTCTYPMGQKPSQELIVKRSASLVTFSQKRKGSYLQDNPKSPKLLKPSSQALQNRPQLAQPAFTNGVHNDSAKITPLQTRAPNYSCQRKPNQPQHAAHEKVEPVIKRPIMSTAAAQPLQESLPKPKPVLNSVSQTVATNASQREIDSSQLDAGSKSVENVDLALQYLQWRNRDKLCWLDVIMCIFVHSRWIGEYCSRPDIPDSSLVRLVKSQRDAMALFRMDPKSTTGSQVLANNRHSLQTNIGTAAENNIAHHAKSGVQTEKYFSEICLEQAETVMARGQDNMWRHLQPKLRCIQGEENSAVCGLMAVLSTEPGELQNLCKVSYRLEAKCAMCGNERINDLEKRVMVFPTVKPEFTMSRPKFHGTCDNCKAKGQQVIMTIQRYPTVLFSHFVGGLPSATKLGDLDFTAHDGSRYAMKAVVQYKRNPDHFVAWIRNHLSGLWMECDDTKDCRCTFDRPDPGFPLDQVHLAMWEKLTDEGEPPIVHQPGRCVGSTVIKITHPKPSIVSANLVARNSAPMPIHARASLSETSPPEPLHPIQAVDENQTRETSQENTGGKTVTNLPETHVSNGQKSSVPVECNGKSSQVLESNSKFYRKPSQAELERVARMRQRFQEHKSQASDKSSMDGISRSETPPLQGVTLKRPLVSSVAPPVVQRRSPLPTHTEQVSSSVPRQVPGQTGSSKKSPDNLKSALAKSEVKTKLKDALSHRVLKYLPDHVSLPFELTVLQETKEPEKPKTMPNGTFAGYVPKAGGCKAEKNQMEMTKVNEKKAARQVQKTPNRRKNVQFNLEVPDRADGSMATAMFLGGSMQKRKPTLVTDNLDKPVCLKRLGKLVKNTESEQAEPPIVTKNCAMLVDNGSVGSSGTSNGSTAISGISPRDPNVHVQNGCVGSSGTSNGSTAISGISPIDPNIHVQKGCVGSSGTSNGSTAVSGLSMIHPNVQKVCVGSSCTSNGSTVISGLSPIHPNIHVQKGFVGSRGTSNESTAVLGLSPIDPSVQNGCGGSRGTSNGSTVISGLSLIDPNAHVPRNGVQRNEVGSVTASENGHGAPVPREATASVKNQNVTLTQGNSTIFQTELHKSQQPQCDISLQNEQQYVRVQPTSKPVIQQSHVRAQLPNGNSQWNHGHYANATPQNAPVHPFRGSPHHGPIRLYAPGTEYHMNVIPTPQRLMNSYPILAQTIAGAGNQSSVRTALTANQVHNNSRAGMDISFNRVSNFQSIPGYSPSELRLKPEYLIQSPPIL